MGSWGTGLYQSDTGLDVRTTYRECKKFGFRGEDLAAVVRDTLGLGPKRARARTTSSPISPWRISCGRTACCRRICGTRRCA